MSGSRKSETPKQVRLSRRGLLVVAGTGVAGHLVGCGDSGSGGGSGGSGAGGTGTGGAGAGGTGTGGKGGSSGTGGSGSAGSGGSGTAGAGGSGGSGAAGSGGSAGGSGGGAGGSSGTGGASADGASPDFAADARIEVGNPPGMPDGGIASCVVTRRDQLGPYHLDGHLMRSTMATANDGQLLVVSGRVLNSKCQPLGGAELDVWSANARGVYSEVSGGWCRGKLRADAEGNYSFTTVYPGPYQGRPRHLHLIIGQPGYSKVTTQMYFKGERPDIPANAVDKVMANGVWNSQWNIVLAGGSMATRLEPALERPRNGNRIVAPGSFPRRFWGAYWRPGKLG